MKLLLYTSYRTGAKSLGTLLAGGLRVKYYHEPYELNNIKNVCVMRITANDDIKYGKLIDIFDKYILLYREDTKAQAESYVWAVKNNIYHFNSEIENYGYYHINDDFLIKNKEEIETYIKIFNNEQKYLKSLEGLKVSYEEIYIEKTGLNKITKYLGSTNNINLKPPPSYLKLRDNIPKKKTLL